MTKTSKVKPKKTLAQLAFEHGYRSGLELQVVQQLESLGIPVSYESPESRISYRVDETRRYTPDFVLPNGIIVETKGRFTSDDRKKHLLIKAQHPDKDIRFVFDRSTTRISKTSDTTYAKWSTQHGYKFADKRIPIEWINE
jgi:hypothetical protein